MGNMKKILVFLAIFMGAFSLVTLPVEEASAKANITKAEAKRKCTSNWKGKWAKKTQKIGARCTNLTSSKKNLCSANGGTFEKVKSGKYKGKYRCVWSDGFKEASGGSGSGSSGKSGSGSGASSRKAGSTASNDCGKGFLGFSPWYKGLTTTVNGKCEIQSPQSSDNGLTVFVITIILNVLADLTLAVGYLAIGFIIYGGYLYIVAGGEPGKVAKGKKTITAAVIGTAIAMLASVILNLIVGALTNTS